MKINLLIISLFFVFTGWAQMPEIQWQQCHSTSDYDWPRSICESENGYLIATSVFETYNIPTYHGSYDILISNVDTSGNIIWQKCFGGTKADIPQKIIKAGNNEYYVYGKALSTDGDIQSGNNGGNDFWVFKINATGDIIWEKTYGSTYYDVPKDIITLPVSGFLFTGEIKNGGGDISIYYGQEDIWLCKCDNEGNIEWEKTLGNQWKDECNGLSLNSEGNIMLAGSTEEQGGIVACNPKGEGDVWIVELDLQGNILCQHCYGGSGYDAGYYIEDIMDGYMILASTTSSDGDVFGYHSNWALNDDIWIVKIDYQGNILWQNCLGGTDIEKPAYISQTEEGNFVVLGNTFSEDGDVTGIHLTPGGYSSDIWFVELSSSGQIEWEHCFGGVDYESLNTIHSVIKKGDYNFLLATQSDSKQSYDVNCNEDGTSVWLINIGICPSYNPEIPDLPTGPDTVYSANNQQSTFHIPPPANAWTIDWKLEPDSAGTVTNLGLQASVFWSPGFEGDIEISARSVNYCGTSEWSEPHYVYVTHCLGVNELQAGNLKLKVYPNPARDYVVFELSTTNYNNVISKSSVIPNPGAGQSARVRNLPAMKNNQRINDSHNSKEIPHPNAQNQPKGFGMTASNGMTGVDGMTVVVFNIFGQEVIKLPIMDIKTVWDTREVKNGIYFHHLEIEGKMISGKVVVQK